MASRSVTEWQDFVAGCIDFRPNDGVFRIARDMFTQPELFDLEMEFIFEKVWIYACHESEIPNNHDFLTVQIGRQPIIISRDGEGELHAMVNACEHRGATLTRVAKGNQSTFSCPFHAWCYKSDGRLVKVKAPSEYCEDFDKSSRGLKQGRIASYRGFVFVSLDVQATDSLEDFLGDAKVFLDLMVEQSPTGELEVLQGKSAYTFAGNWKLQNENGLDGYHVSTVHYNYVSTVQHRQQVNAAKGSDLDTLDYSKLGAGDNETDDGWFSFKNGHSVLFSDMPNPTVRPGYETVMPYLVEFREQQKGFQARLERWSDISRGHHTWCYGPTQNSQDLAIEPVITGREFTHEGLYVNQHGHWQQLMLDGLKKKALKLHDITHENHTVTDEV